MPSMPTTAREAALLYHQLGIAVVPLPTRSKKPGFDDWQGFLFDPADLDKHFPDGEERNIAGLNGEPSRCGADADLDCSEAIEAGKYLLPHTGCVFGRATSPQSHYLYRTSTAFPSASRKFCDPLITGDESRATICELRGTGGITVLPPSLHKETGETITWDRFDGDPAQVPLQLLIERVEDIAVVSLLARYWPAKGQRDECYLALAGGLVRGVDAVRAERIIDALAAVTDDEEARDRVKKAKRAENRIKDGGKTVGWPRLASLLGDPGEKVVKAVREWLKLTDAPGSSEEWPDPIPLGEPPGVPDFPTDALPNTLADFVRCIAEATQTPPDLAGVLVLVTAGAGLARRYSVRVRPGWVEPLNLFGVVALPPGDRKSAVFRETIAPVWDHEQAEQERLAPLIAEQESERRQLEGRLKNLEGRVAKAEADDKTTLQAQAKEAAQELARHEVVSKPRLVCDDVTPEKLADLMAEQGGRIFQAAPEGTLFEIAKGRYQESGKANFDVYLKGHAGDSLPTDRISRKSTCTRSPALSVALAVQPDVISGLAAQPTLRNRGFLARFLYAIPVSLVGRRKVSACPVPESVREAYRECILRLWRMPGGTGDDGKPEPHEMGMSQKADEAVAQFEEWLEPRLAQGGELSHLAGWANKLAGACARIAGVIHLANGCSPDNPIDVDTVSAAIRLGKTYFLPQAIAAFYRMGASDTQAQARQVWEAVRSKVADVAYVARGGTVSRRELFEWNRRRFTSVTLLDPIIEVLADHYYLRPEGDGRVGRGNKGPKYTINPKALNGQQHTEAQRTQRTQPPPADREHGDFSEPDEDSADDLGGCTQRTQRTQPDGEAAGDHDGEADVADVVDVAYDGERGRNPDVAGGDEGGLCTLRTLRTEGRTPVDVFEGKAVGGYERSVRNSPGQGNKTASDETCYTLIQTPRQLACVLSAIEEADLVALDTETTGLDPTSDRVRLLSLALPTIDGGWFSYLVDCFAVDPRPILDALRDKELVGHNLTFDLRFLVRMGFEVSGRLHDTFHLSRILHAGEGWSVKHGLEDLAERHLGVKMDKTLQRSDWNDSLTAEQLSYAAADVLVLHPLLAAIREKLREADLVNTADIESRCQPAIVWMAVNGVAIDSQAWTNLVRAAETRTAQLKEHMRALAPVPPNELFVAWNWDSPLDMKRLFASLGEKLDSTDDDTLASVKHPIAGLLREYREASKRRTTYGEKWLQSWVKPDGRVYADWKQTGADASGRMSCGDPNMQQLPRDNAYRRCVVAPPGRMLCKIDFSQIELRIAAKVSGDKAMLEAYQRGEDLHTLTARSVLGIEEVTKQHRQLAKAVNFGLLYGMGAEGFQGYAKSNFGVELTLDEARQYRTAFFRSYPGLRKWQQSQKDGAIDTRTLAGRRRSNVTAYTEKLNTPVQGTGADGLKIALALLWERRHEVLGAFPVMAVHDEIVIECDEAQAEAAAPWLKQAMLDAMAPLIDPVPVEVDVKIARTWGGD